MPKKGEKIYKRKDGRWEGRYRSGTRDDGRGIYRSVYGKSCSDVRKKLSSRTELVKDVEPLSYKTFLFRDAVSLWRRANGNRYKGATEMKYDYLIDTHILPVLGRYKLPEISTLLLADFMNRKLQNGRIDRTGGLSPSYVRTMMMIIFEIIDFAAEEDMCPPLKTKLRKPSIQTSDPSILDKSSQIRLENHLSATITGTNVGILISLNTGLRISEVCALRWTDVDLINAVLHVRTTVARVKSTDGHQSTQLIIDRPKTKSSIRDIPLSKKLMSVLTLWRKMAQSEYVISEKPGFISPRTYEYRFHRTLDACEIPSINYHALRHTFATRCIELGVDVKTLSEILGHASVSVTLNTYVHSSMERKREQMEKLSSIFE